VTIPPLAGHLEYEVVMPTVKDKPEPVRRRGRYPKEYRRDACALVLDQKRSVTDVARELGLVEQTIYLWLRQERIDRGEAEGLSTSEREELRPFARRTASSARSVSC
jgi:transposase-like protein